MYREVLKVQWICDENPPVLLEEHSHCGHCGSLIAVDEWMAANQGVK